MKTKKEKAPRIPRVSRGRVPVNQVFPILVIAFSAYPALQVSPTFNSYPHN